MWRNKTESMPEQLNKLCAFFFFKWVLLSKFDYITVFLG